MLRICIVLGACALFCSAQATIIDTGSTNRPGMNITVEERGEQATIERRGAAGQAMKLTKEMCDRFMRDLKAAGSLNDLPKTHCMKSVSFGSSLYVEYQGARSPDLSCPQHDPRAAALKKDVAEIWAAARNYPALIYH